jgi:hypothetical protein
MRPLARLRARYRRIAPTLIALATALSFLFVQSAVAASAAAGSRAGTIPHVPCEMGDGAMQGAHQVNLDDSQASDKGSDHPCPLMQGAVCLTLTAANVPQARELPMVRIAAIYAWPADTDVMVRPITPPDRPPKSL